VAGFNSRKELDEFKHTGDTQNSEDLKNSNHFAVCAKRTSFHAVLPQGKLFCAAHTGLPTRVMSLKNHPKTFWSDSRVSISLNHLKAVPCNVMDSALQ
jgi:hypothetical protein